MTDPDMSAPLLTKEDGSQLNPGKRTSSVVSFISEFTTDLRHIKVNMLNTQKKKCFFCCSKNVPKYKNNKVSTSKYNILTFLPLNLMLQFSKMANFYFLCLMIAELYPPISDSEGKPVLGLPLGFVVLISMIKDIYEDIQRHRQDNDENNRKVEIAVSKTRKISKKDKMKEWSFKSTRWQNITVGSIVKVYENQYFPCDLLLLNSSAAKGICYVETKNLDGETNLKHKQAQKEYVQLSKTDMEVMRNFNEASIECEKENEFIYKFFGTMRLREGSE